RPPRRPARRAGSAVRPSCARSPTGRASRTRGARAAAPALPPATNGRAQHWYASQTSRTHARSSPTTSRGERRTRTRRRPGRECPAGAPSSCFGRLEVPVVVLGALGLADHVRGARPREEVVVLVRVGAQRREDRRVDVGLVAREQRLVS